MKMMKLYAALSELINDDNLTLVDSDYCSWDSVRCRKLFSYISKQLDDLGAKRGDRVAILLEKDIYYTAAILICMAKGITYVPLSKSWSQYRIDQIREVINLKIFIEDKFFEKYSEAYSFDGLEVINRSEEEILYIIFTSGSTGNPKGVPISVKNYEAFLKWTQKEFSETSKSSRLLNTTDYTFDVSLAELSFLLCFRLPYYHSGFKGNLFALAQEIDKLKINILATVPNNLQFIFHENCKRKFSFESLNILLVAGSQFPLSLYSIVKNLNFIDKIYNCYGPTEATIYSSYKRLMYEQSEVFEGMVSIGNSLPGASLALSDESELLVSGQQVFNGYIEGSTFPFVEIGGEKFYKTGDIAKCNLGEYFIFGRIDNTLKVNGYRVNLDMISQTATLAEGAVNAIAISVPDLIRENQIVMFVIKSFNARETDVVDNIN